MKKKDTSCQRNIKPSRMKFRRQKLQQEPSVKGNFSCVDKKIDGNFQLRDPNFSMVSWKDRNHRPQKAAKAYNNFPDFNQTTLH